MSDFSVCTSQQESFQMIRLTRNNYMLCLLRSTISPLLQRQNAHNPILHVLQTDRILHKAPNQVQRPTKSLLLCTQL